MNQSVRSRRALVLGSDDGFLAFASEALDSFGPGFDVATATTPEQAADWLDTFSPDLIVMMPGDDEFERFAGELVTNGRIRAERVVRSFDLGSLPSLLTMVRSAAR